MATKGFTKISNSKIFDFNLSCEALGLYVKLAYYKSIPNFKLNREFIKSLSGYGDTAFRRVWKELKEKMIVIQFVKKIDGKFVYEYKINTNIIGNSTVEVDETVEIENTMEDSEPVEETISNDVKEVIKETNFTVGQAKQLLSKVDVKSIIDYFRYSLTRAGNKFAYVESLIERKANIHNERNNSKPKGSWNNYEQRPIPTGEEMNIFEQKLLGLYNYDNEEVQYA